MKTVTTISEVRAQVAAWRGAGERVVLVPTMGNLHAGHLALVERARELGPRVVVSIFVNPLQFGEGEDLESYPRTPEEDGGKLAAAGVDLLFSPGVGEMYPRGRGAATRVEVPGLSDILCGAFRPRHFRGVTTVVSKLFNIVQPDAAVFGEKDYQQLVLIRRMAADLCIPVEVIGVPTVRESDGLAMSSRNGYLDDGERRIAAELYRTLLWVAERLEAGDGDYRALEEQGVERLERAGFRPQYLSVCAADSLEAPRRGERRLAVLAAAYLGKTRLIDNILIIK